MTDKPAIDEIRARLANHTAVLCHQHYAADVAVLLAALDDPLAQRPYRDALCEVLERLGADGNSYAAHANKAATTEEVLRAICEHVMWLEQRVRDEMKADVESAEARGRAAERADVIAWLRDVGDQYMNGDMAPCDEFTGEAYHQAAGEIETGRHVAAAVEMAAERGEHVGAKAREDGGESGT